MAVRLASLIVPLLGVGLAGVAAVAAFGPVSTWNLFEPAPNLEIEVRAIGAVSSDPAAWSEIVARILNGDFSSVDAAVDESAGLTVGDREFFKGLVRYLDFSDLYNLGDAFAFLEAGARAGSEESLIVLAFHVLEGENKADHRRALQLLGKIRGPLTPYASLGQAGALLSLRERLPEFASLVRPAYRRGLPQANTYMAFAYLLGIGADRDIALARSLFLRDARIGYPQAQHSLAALVFNEDCHVYGSDGLTDESVEQAMFWLALAARQGQESARSILERCRGHYALPLARSEAERWFSLERDKPDSLLSQAAAWCPRGGAVGDWSICMRRSIEDDYVCQQDWLALLRVDNLRGTVFYDLCRKHEFAEN